MKKIVHALVFITEPLPENILSLYINNLTKVLNKHVIKKLNIYVSLSYVKKINILAKEYEDMGISFQIAYGSVSNTICKYCNNSQVSYLILDNVFYDINYKNFINFHLNQKSDITVTLRQDIIYNHHISFNKDYKIYRSSEYQDNTEFIYTHTKVYLINGATIYNNSFKNLNININTISSKIKNLNICIFPTVGKYLDLTAGNDFTVYENFFDELFEEKGKAIFLDRDGTINVDKGYVYRTDDFEFIDGAIEALVDLKHSGYKLVVITNQSGVARGYYTESDINTLHNWINKQLYGKAGIIIDKFYYCPHHPSEATNAKYLKSCNCRKPMPGLILKAAEELNIDLDKSFMIGDKETDEVILPEVNFLKVKAGCTISGLTKNILGDFNNVE